MVNLQDKPVTVNLPIEIEQATNNIRLLLSQLPWVSHPYHIAQRFYRKENSKVFYYPETYSGGVDGKFSYQRLTPDNDYSGMFFFVVGDEENDYENNEFNYLTHNVSIIFSCNLKLIDESKLNSGLFTQELIRDVRRMLTANAMLFDFMYKIKTVTRDLKSVYREFTLDEIEQYNRAPLQCFRFDLSVTVQEDCYNITTSSVPNVINSDFSIEVVNVTGQVLPLEVPVGTGFLIINVDGMTDDLNLHTYKPSGLTKGATVRVRKMDNTNFKIKYTVGDLDYSFVNCTTEFIDLLWDGSKLII